MNSNKPLELIDEIYAQLDYLNLQFVNGSAEDKTFDLHKLSLTQQRLIKQLLDVSKQIQHPDILEAGIKGFLKWLEGQDLDLAIKVSEYAGTWVKQLYAD